MAKDDPSDGLVRVLWRIVVRFFDQRIVDALLRTPGYLLVKLLSPLAPREPDPDGLRVAVVGLRFWLAFCAVVYVVLLRPGFPLASPSRRAPQGRRLKT